MTSVAVCVDLDLVASSSKSRGLLFHSVSKGRLLRTVQHIEQVDSMVISPEGLVVVWDRSMRSLKSVTVNGTEVCCTEIGEEYGDVSAMEISKDGLFLAIGTSISGPPRGKRRSSNISEPDNTEYNNNNNSSSNSNNGNNGNVDEDSENESRFRKETKNARNVDKKTNVDTNKEKGSDKFSRPVSMGDDNLLSFREWEGNKEEEKARFCPVIAILEIYTLKVVHKFPLERGCDVTSLSLSEDDTYLFCSTSNGELLVYTDPQLSVRLVDQMLRLGWEGSGFLT